jgi:hypothetical protein
MGYVSWIAVLRWLLVNREEGEGCDGMRGVPVPAPPRPNVISFVMLPLGVRLSDARKVILDYRKSHGAQNHHLIAIGNLIASNILRSTQVE